MSHINLPTEKVKLACERHFKAESKWVKENQDKIIDYYVGKRKHWFTNERHTYESAKQMLESESQSFMSDWSMAQLHHSDYYKVNAIYTLAKHGDPVTITSDDSFLLRYLELDNNQKPT